MTDDRDARIAALQAVLRPLLREDRWLVCDGERYHCVHCDAEQTAEPARFGVHRRVVHHAPDCPVLRRDELLGR